MLKSNVLNHNTIIELENAEFFEHVFPLQMNIESVLLDNDRQTEKLLNEPTSIELRGVIGIGKRLIRW